LIPHAGASVFCEARLPDISNANIPYWKDQLEFDDAMQHNEPVSSKSLQKELDLSPPNSGLFFIRRVTHK
jgi:hypothetical protein